MKEKEGTIITDWLKENPIPLDTRIRVSTQMAFINLITELGYRENKYWTPDEDELLNKLMNLAEKHTQDILNEIKEWEDVSKLLEE